MISLVELLAAEPDARRDRALHLGAAALRAVDGEASTRRVLSQFNLPRRAFVLSFGKAAESMARAAIAVVPDAWGFVIGAQRVEVGGLVSLVGGHPVPTPDAVDTGRAVLAAAKRLGEGDVALCLVSGGGSAMLELPRLGVKLQDIELLTQRAMLCGLPIGALNRERTRLSQLKGGQLAEAMAPARVVNIVISDVPGCAPSVIASGPTWTGSDYAVAADNQAAQEALVEAGAALGLRLARIEPIVAGEASRAGASFMRNAARILAEDEGVDGVVGGGETTVTVLGDGRGGRNGEFVAGAAAHLGEHLMMSLATDGLDGTSEGAGALLDAAGLRLGRVMAGPLELAAQQNDTARWFRRAGLLLGTGPTGTNVADLHLVLR